MKKRSAILLFASTFVVSFLLLTIFQEDLRLKQPKTSGAYEALNFWNMQRTYPYKKMPADKYNREYETSKLHMSKANAELNLDDQWTEIGPHNIGGRTISLAINPENPNTIYAGSASGGLWRSKTSGEGADAWDKITTGFPVLGVHAVAIDPTDTNTLFIGTGEVYQYQKALGGVAIRETRGSYGIGILKSTDAGQTWEKSLDWTYNQERGVFVIKFEPGNPDVIWTGTTEGTFKSTDYGNSWNQVHDVIMVNDILINEDNPDYVLISCGNLASTGHGIYKTTDGGSSFSKINSGLPSSFGGKALFSPYKQNFDYVYLSIGNGYYSGAGTWMCKSTDFGDTWSIINTYDYATYQGWFAHFVVLNQSDSSKLLAAGVDVFKSSNGGISLNQKSYWYKWYFGTPPAGGPEGPPDYSHADHHCFAVHPTDPNIIYFGNDGGVFRTTDFGETFEGLNGGYQTTQFYNGFTSSQSDSTIAMGGMQDNSTAMFSGSVEWYRVIGGDGSWTAIHPVNPNHRYGSWQYLNVQKSTNGGINWFTLSIPGNGTEAFIAPFALAPSNPATIYAARTIVYKSINSGFDWTATQGGSAITNNLPISIAVSHQNPDVAYITTAPTSSLAKIFRTTNGNNWTDITGALPDRYPMDVAVDPQNDSTLYIALSGFETSHIYKSTDMGESWIDIGAGLPDIPANAVIVDPHYSDYIYTGNDFGVYASTDGGGSWIEFSEGLPDVVIAKDLTVTPSNRSIRVATHGNGAFQRELITPVTSVNDEIIPTKSVLYQNYPNPFNPSTSISFQVPVQGDVQLKVFDLLGREVRTLINKSLQPGKHKVEFNAENLASGTYIYRLTIGNFSASKKMILLR
ncbi:MAG: T9SS type A sorting domain-containing protein [Melioribacteraceae bacterium]|nr:T9SS type A sorting domain-containing protein [Melioribacteraceae bacterium]MCF8356687.1 T9SS type A sorting domain-containing protein [Melioribacteraceae bacterium]MCF8395557.1 T9SS type A sorting domain-containing protein [Melioribacteraceae bacterium]MCF8420857.1 T9SS type A sorting domain-containing protein [Melioribacteraceae bacterium]